MFKKLFKNEKGSTMLIATMGIAVISILTMAVFFMSSSNARQTQREGKKTQAYYVADAGAKALIKNLEEKPEEIEKKLIDLAGEDKIEGTYQGWDFKIVVSKVKGKEKEYDIRSTGEVDDIKDGTVARVSLVEQENNGGGDYIMGDGVIFITGTGNGIFQFHNLSQFSGTNLNIYTMNKAVTSINDGTSGYAKTEYKEKGAVVKETFKKGDDSIAFNYNMNKEQVLKNYSGEQLPNGSLKGDDLEKILAGTHLLPITNIEEYEAYLKSPEIFPIVTYKLPEGGIEEKLTFGSKGDIDLRGKRYVSVSRKVELKKGITNIKTSGDIDIDFKSGFHAEEGVKLNIHANGRVNIYIDKHFQTDGGDIEVISEGSNSQVNFYMNDRVQFQTQDATKVVGVNLYAPKSDVQFQEKAQWEGVVIANQLEFNDNAKFKAPSAGSLSSDENKVIKTDFNIEWKEWQKDK